MRLDRNTQLNGAIVENTKQEDRIKELESILKEINEADLLPEYYKNRIEEALKRERRNKL